MANGHGGARKGAGRKKTINRQKIAESIIDRRIKQTENLPLAIMLQLMQEALEEGDKETAFSRAKECAPYVHARLSNVEQTTHTVTDAAELSDDDLINIARASGARIAETEESAEEPNRLHS